MSIWTYLSILFYLVGIVCHLPPALLLQTTHSYPPLLSRGPDRPLPPARLLLALLPPVCPLVVPRHVPATDAHRGGAVLPADPVQESVLCVPVPAAPGVQPEQSGRVCPPGR